MICLLFGFGYDVIMIRYVLIMIISNDKYQNI